MSLRSKIILIVLVVVLLCWYVLDTSFAGLYTWLNAETYSLDIDSDEIYHIRWMSWRGSMHEVTDKAEIEEIVEYINTWALVEWWSGAPRPSGATPELFVSFLDEDGNYIWRFEKHGSGHIWDSRTNDRHQIRNAILPWNQDYVGRFDERFG